jgi:predicted glycosyltransferase
VTRNIGYYVHHQGAGHRQRAGAIAAAFEGKATLIGTGLAESNLDLPLLDLPDDRLGDGAFDGDDRTDTPPPLHYAPLDHAGVRLRVAAISSWIADAHPDLMVVDVSVEVAMLARLASVPIVYMRLSGRRGDRPHCDAFASAAALIAPFAEVLDDPATPDRIRDKTFYAGNIVRPAPVQEVEPDTVLVVAGRGGEMADGTRWAQAAAAVPDRRWRVIGPVRPPSAMPGNIVYSGWIEDAERAIAAAGIVIGAAGDGLVSAVLAYDRPFICFPEVRAFDEQASKAARLAQLDAAIVPAIWPDAQNWRILIDAAVQQPHRRPAVLRTNDGADRAAQFLAQLVDKQRGSAEQAG